MNRNDYAEVAKDYGHLAHKAFIAKDITTLLNHKLEFIRACEKIGMPSDVARRNFKAYCLGAK
jgi:hypothetical protein